MVHIGGYPPTFSHYKRRLLVTFLIFFVTVICFSVRGSYMVSKNILFVAVFANMLTGRGKG